MLYGRKRCPFGQRRPYAVLIMDTESAPLGPAIVPPAGRPEPKASLSRSRTYIHTLTAEAPRKPESANTRWRLGTGLLSHRLAMAGASWGYGDPRVIAGASPGLARLCLIGPILYGRMQHTFIVHGPLERRLRPPDRMLLVAHDVVCELERESSTSNDSLGKWGPNRSRKMIRGYHGPIVFAACQLSVCPYRSVSPRRAASPKNKIREHTNSRQEIKPFEEVFTSAGMRGGRM